MTSYTGLDWRQQVATLGRLVRGGSRYYAQVLAFGFVLAMAACDTTVTNPGRYEDRFLDLPTAHNAVVNGAARRLSDGLNDVSYTTAAISRELFPGGSTSSFGITPRQQQGILAYDDEHVQWVSLQQSRFIAEQGYERFRAEREEAQQPFDGYEPAARAALIAGYANRVLGENWCELAFDGGPLVPDDSALRRAEGWFSTALTMARAGDIEEIEYAALAGRASVRMRLGDWGGAVADAAIVPTNFRYTAKYTTAAVEQYNMIYWAGASSPYRAHTVWRTQYDDYYTETSDRRVRWALHPTQAEGDAAVLDLGKVPFHQQQKYTTQDAPINLSSGREMRLIEIEAMLRDGDYATAVSRMNELRTAVGAPAISASNLEAAWTLFKRERGIELWLEGRRMGDLRRWKETNTPGALHTLELPGEISKLSDQQSMCYEVPKTERETNPNAR